MPLAAIKSCRCLRYALQSGIPAQNRRSPRSSQLNAKEIDMRKLIGAVALALFLLATSTPVFAQETAKKVTLGEKETLLGKLADSKDMRALSISNDYNHLAILTQKGDKYLVTVDGVPGKEYEWIVARSLTYSSDSKRLGYVVQQGDSMFVVMDGKEGKPYREI